MLPPSCSAGSPAKDGNSPTASEACKSRVSTGIRALISPFFLTWHSTFGGVNCKKLDLLWSVAGGEADTPRSSSEISHLRHTCLWGDPWLLQHPKSWMIGKKPRGCRVCPTACKLFSQLNSTFALLYCPLGSATLGAIKEAHVVCQCLSFPT